LNKSLRHALIGTDIGHVVMIIVVLLEGSGILMLRRMMKFEV
jgi:Flp pilus assembly protein TadB